MKRTRKSRAKKPAVTIPTAYLEYVSQHDIERGYQHIMDIIIACRQVEVQLRQQGQNPLADTLKYLNLAEPRLTDAIIDNAIRPFFYFGSDHDKIPNQKPFQDAVCEKLSNPDARSIFELMIRRYFQVFDFRIDGRNGKKTIRVALDRNGTPKQSVPSAVHSVFPWSPANKKAAIYVGQLVTWNDCKFFVAYGRINPKVFTALKRSSRTHRDITHGDFLDGIQSQLFIRLADPFDKHRLDQYLLKNTPSHSEIFSQLACHILGYANPTRLSHLVAHAVQQTNTHDIAALNQKVNKAYEAIVLDEHGYFTSVPKNIPRSTLHNILLCDPATATQHLQEIEQHPLKYLLLTPATLASANLSPTNTIHQARTAELSRPLQDTIESAWKAYVTEQRLLKILGDPKNSSFFYEAAILDLVFQTAAPQFLHTKILDIPLKERFQNYLLADIAYYIYDYPTYIYFDKITLDHLVNPPEDHHPINFDALPKATKTHFTQAIVQYLSTWRQTAAPTLTNQPTTAQSQAPAPIPSTPEVQTALDALDEINELFDTQ